MLKAVRDMIRRLGFVGGLVLALVFATPAIEAHACIADSPAAASGDLAFMTDADHGETCPDCGPACASMCCHAPHAGVTPDLSPLGAHALEHPAPWLNQQALAAAPPSGPDQPPRS